MAENFLDTSSWAIDYSDIMDIFKNNLKIENSIKSIHSIFLNKRYSEKINYKPYFQRNYVWDEEKASYFIESILLGTEIPPIVLFKSNTQNDVKNEVIDGRQRFETLLRFIKCDFALQLSGLHRLYQYAGLKFNNLDSETSEEFLNTKLRILQCSVSNEPSLTPEKEDKIKKEIFKRYNSGITPLNKEENARAEYIDDKITIILKSKLENSPSYLNQIEDLFLSKSKQKTAKRDKVNFLLNRIRTLITLTKVPIYNYAGSSHRSDIIRKFYALYIAKGPTEIIIEQFNKVINLLILLKKYFNSTCLFNDVLFYECIFWAFFIMESSGINICFDDLKTIAQAFEYSSSNSIFWKSILNTNKTPEAIFELTGSHYRNATIDRFRFVSNYFNYKYGMDFELYLKDTENFKISMDKNLAREQLIESKLIKPDPVSITIDDIIHDMSDHKFLVRPMYQRSEVKNIKKASYLLESIILGIKIPPIYIFKRSDKVKEVIDGQQRLLTLIGFTGATYEDENGLKQLSEKHKFKLSGLKILKELNGLNIDMIQERYPQYYDNIFDFSIDVVEIDETQNPNFNSIDLFLRLNTKPFPIKPNTFEMWNAYVEQSITQKIKDLVLQNAGKIFKKNDTRMSNEELITALAYLNYQKQFKGSTYQDLLTVYIRDNHICSRISLKDRITKMLESLSQNSVCNFEESITSVAKFINKLCCLVGKNGEKFSELIGTSHRTDQIFYFLW